MGLGIDISAQTEGIHKQSIHSPCSPRGHSRRAITALIPNKQQQPELAQQLRGLLAEAECIHLYKNTPI